MNQGDPSQLAELLAWLDSQSLAFYAPASAFAVAILRGVYYGGKFRRSCVEGAVFALMTYALKSLLAWASMPPDLALIIGSFAAFIGIDTIRAYSITWLAARLGIKLKQESEQ